MQIEKVLIIKEVCWDFYGKNTFLCDIKPVSRINECVTKSKFTNFNSKWSKFDDIRLIKSRLDR